MLKSVSSPVLVSDNKFAISSLKIIFNSSVPRYLSFETLASILSIILRVVSTPTSEEFKISSKLSRTASSTLDFPATAFDSLVKKLDFDFYAQNVFKRSVFSSKEKCMEFLQNPTLSRVSRDLAFTTMNSIYDKYMKEIYPTRKSVRAALSKGNRLFMSGLREMDTSKSFYPDANSTMRVTYGSIGDYSPGNAMHYDYFTTIDGIIEKEDETNEEFIVPEKLKELYKMSDYGRYADKNGDLRINFISSNDITGGNSGSPVMNAWGELIGTAFDGNWESMSGDIAFENKIQRTISVDIRYILFIIDKYANASYLIDEMTIAPSHKNDSVVIVTDVITEEIDVISSDKNDEIDKSELNDSLETKNYNGKDIPIISSGSFNNAFMQAVIQLGASSDQFFCWNNNIYTTEKE